MRFSVYADSDVTDDFDDTGFSYFYYQSINCNAVKYLNYKVLNTTMPSNIKALNLVYKYVRNMQLKGFVMHGVYSKWIYIDL